MCDQVTWNTLYCGLVLPSKLDACDQVTVSYKRFRKVCPQCNSVVHTMEFNRSMCLRKVCPQCTFTSTYALHAVSFYTPIIAKSNLLTMLCYVCKNSNNDVLLL